MTAESFSISVGPRQANLVLIAYASSESRGTFRQKARSLAPLNGWACAVKICHDGMLEDTNSLDGAQLWLSSVYEIVLSESLGNLHLRLSVGFVGSYDEKASIMV